MQAYQNSREKLIYVAVVAVLGAVITYLLARPVPLSTPIVMEPAASSSAPQSLLGNQTSPPTNESPATAILIVHVGGLVKKPGIVRLPIGARVFEAIDKAGGALAGADIEQVNLAQKLEDGQKVYLPKKGEAPPAEIAPLAGSSGGNSEAKGRTSKSAALAPKSISLNSASASQLDRLPGVGPSTAAKILEYRRDHGGFVNIDELLSVKGIGPKKLAAMRPFLKL